jgi:hypothetical protein
MRSTDFGQVSLWTWNNIGQKYTRNIVPRANRSHYYTGLRIVVRKIFGFISSGLAKFFYHGIV